MPDTFLEERLRRSGQLHLWEHLQSLEGSQRQAFQEQLSQVDFDRLRRIFLAATAQPTAGTAVDDVCPIESVTELGSASDEEQARWRELGLGAIARGEVAGLLLAGGQGTRLGSSQPKGCYDIGLPSGRSLFALHAERILALQRAAASWKSGLTGARVDVGKRGGEGEELAVDDSSPPSQDSTNNNFPDQRKLTGGMLTPPPPKGTIPWCIMTSESTDEATRAHFAAHNFFGLHPAQVFFFEQGVLPAVDESGGALLARPGSLALSPDGNGGVYAALAASGALTWLRGAGVVALDVWPVDNALAAPLAPGWVGRCLASRAALGCRVAAKTLPEERVGVLARRGDGGLAVLEYSELAADRAAATAPDGKLLYRWANLCLHWFTLDWLQAVVAALEGPGGVTAESAGQNNASAGAGIAPLAAHTTAPAYHVARKSIPTLHGAVPGIKMELFIFDVFSLLPDATLAVVQVDRAEEFAPVKNAVGNDSPATARDAVLRLHTRWVQQAGGRVDATPGVEVAPAVSLDGRGLEHVCRGASFSQAWDPRLQGSMRAEAQAGSRLVVCCGGV